MSGFLLLRLYRNTCRHNNDMRKPGNPDSLIPLRKNWHVHTIFLKVLWDSQDSPLSYHYYAYSYTTPKSQGLWHFLYLKCAFFNLLPDVLYLLPHFLRGLYYNATLVRLLNLLLHISTIWWAFCCCSWKDQYGHNYNIKTWRCITFIIFPVRILK